MSTGVPRRRENNTFLAKENSNDFKKSIDCKVDILMYEEDGIHYVYSPALDLVGYGKTGEEALASWEVVIEEYLRYGLEKDTLANDLKSHGWSIKKSTNELQPPLFSWLLTNNDQLSEMYDKHSFHKTSRLIALPM